MKSINVSWLLSARKVITQAMKEEYSGNGMQFISFFGKTKHWVSWERIYQSEKRKLKKKYERRAS